MEIKALKCPNCDGILEVEDGLDTFYCKYCGYKIILDGQSDIAYISKVQIKSMEHEEKIKEKELAHEKYIINEKNKFRESIIGLIIMIFLLILLMAFTAYFVKR